MEEQEAPWSVEVPKSELARLLGPNNTTIKRLSAATGCELEVARQPKKQLKKISYGGQDQYLDGDDDKDAKVKVFMRGPPKKRLIAAEVLQAVAEGEDPEDHAARAEGAYVFEHELRHPDKEAWARWRLLAAAHKHGAKAHLGRKTVRLTLKSGAAFTQETADLAHVDAEKALEETNTLVEVRVDALDELEPEEAPADPAVAPFVDQFGVIIRVCDQDDNKLEETIAIRLFGPPDATEDAAAVLRARFVEGKATASLLQPTGEVQAMAADRAGEFANDLKTLESECKVKIHKGKTALWISGADAEVVADARATLQEMLQFYLPTAFKLVSGITPAAAERLLADDDLGVVMAHGDTVVAVDEAAGTVWVGGKQRAAVQTCIDAALRAPPPAASAEAEDDRPAAKRRRTSALSFHSVAL